MPITQSVPAILKEARWIWPENMGFDMYNCYALFRKIFALETVPVRAPLFITADQSYQLYINGKFVCRGPARGFQDHWPYDEVNVSDYLRSGKNLIAVRAHNPGLGNFQYITKGYAGLLVAAHWGTVKIRTNHTWRTIRQAGISKDTVPTSLQLFPQEVVDTRIASDNWMTRGFDDSAWKPDEVGSCAWNAMPWYSLETRGIPMLKEVVRFPVALLGEAQGVCAKGYANTRDVVKTRHSEKLTHQPIKGRPRLLKAGATGKGKFRSYLFDFGQTVVGSPAFTIEGASGGEMIDTLHVETIDQARLKPHLKIPSHCRMAFGNRLICHKGKNHWRFYHTYGFRYMVVTVRDSKRPLTIKPSLNWVGYPLDGKGSFEHSDRDLENIWKTCAWTQQCCSLDAYVDTPWREQAQWWGDARVQAWNTFHLNGDARLFRRGIHCIASQTTPNGLTYGHAPTIAHHCILPDFTITWLLTLWDHYWQTGETEAFSTHQHEVEQALAYFKSQLDPRRELLRYDERYWLFLDWTGIPKKGCSAVYSLWLLDALEKLKELYERTQQKEQAQSLGRWAKRLRRALRTLINKDGLLQDGFDEHGKLLKSTSIHAQTLALITNLYPKGEQTMLNQILLPFIKEERSFAVSPSAYWITYVFEELARRGYGEEVVRFIVKYWKPMAEHGTTWEDFKPVPGDISHSHAWSAHPLYHLMQIIGGVRQTQAGWKAVHVEPTFIGSHGKVTFPTPKGVIRSEWKRVNDKIKVALKCPKTVEAEVVLPGEGKITLHGKRNSGVWVLNR